MMRMIVSNRKCTKSAIYDDDDMSGASKYWKGARLGSWIHITIKMVTECSFEPLTRSWINIRLFDKNKHRLIVIKREFKTLTQD